MSGGRRAVDEQLVSAVYAGDVSGVRRALAAGADPNLVVQAGETILMLATSAPGGTWVLRMLLARGSRLDAVDDVGRTPLHHAAMAGRADVARLLLERGARADATTPDGKTALDFALDIGQKMDLVSRLRAHTSAPPPDIAAKTLATAALPAVLLQAMPHILTWCPGGPGHARTLY